VQGVGQRLDPVDQPRSRSDHVRGRVDRHQRDARQVRGYPRGLLERAMESGMEIGLLRKVDPQLAAVYWSQMVERGAHHTKAVCVVAARLAARAHAVMTRGEPYVIRDLDGRPVTTAEAREIIAAKYHVPEHVRRRRRAQQGKAPQAVPQGTALLGDLPHRNASAHLPWRRSPAQIPRGL